MSETNNDSNFDTSQWYAIFAGWLFVPIIIAFMRLLGAIIMVIFVNPSQITGLELTIYYGDLISLPILIPTFIMLDRKSTRLNSSHVAISYAVFCLKKKKRI